MVHRSLLKLMFIIAVTLFISPNTVIAGEGCGGGGGGGNVSSGGGGGVGNFRTGGGRISDSFDDANTNITIDAGYENESGVNSEFGYSIGGGFGRFFGSIFNNASYGDGFSSQGNGIASGLKRSNLGGRF